MRTRRLPPLLLLLLTGCGHHQEGSSSSSSEFFVEGGRTDLSLKGVSIEIRGSVQFRMVQATDSRGSLQSEATINGHSYEVSSGRFRIGDQDYGEAPEGSRVLVKDEGVFIDDVLRGPVPATLESKDR